MIFQLILAAGLLSTAYGWAAWRWRWGWVCWPVPAALFIAVLIFLTGLQRNWDSSYLFHCELRQLISSLSGENDTIRRVGLAPDQWDWLTVAIPLLGCLTMIGFLIVRSCCFPQHKRGLALLCGSLLLVFSVLAGGLAADRVQRQKLFREHQAAVAEIHLCIGRAREAGVSAAEILACLRDCREHGIVSYERPGYARQSMQYTLSALRKLAAK